MVTLGIENLIKSPPDWLEGQRLGLLCNQASTDRQFRHSRDLIHQAFPGQLTCIFTPQHGFFSEKQDNMVESGHAVDSVTGLPIYSLYSETRRPTAEMFDHLDILLVDLVDVGTRVYTFLYTLAYCMEAAAKLGKKVVVLDRPNPLGGIAIEGNLLKEDCRSFVGLYPIPMSHGLTFGEIAKLINDEFAIRAELDVIPLQGWSRNMLFQDTGLPWVFPSPNMPTSITALVYPGQVIWEGTNISEGRGTCLPFELCGAPFLEIRAVMEQVSKVPLPGCCLRPVVFEPTSNKWAGQACRGFQVHITDSRAFRPYRMSLAILQALIKLYPSEFQYKTPPYEYEYERLPMDLILGDKSLRQGLEQGESLLELEAGWQEDLGSFDKKRKKYFLYN